MLELKEGSTLIVKGDFIEAGATKIVNGGERNSTQNTAPVSEEEFLRKLECVKPRIDVKRQWFSVCKYMMWHKIVAEGDFKAAVAHIEALYPGLNLDVNDMQRLNNLSFRKPLDMWDVSNAPVAGNTFAKYLMIAELMESA